MTEARKHYWRSWAKAAGVRALRTWAQAMIAAMPVTAATLGSIDWAMCASTATVAAVLSLLTSVAGLPEVPDPDEPTTVMEAVEAYDEAYEDAYGVGGTDAD